MTWTIIGLAAVLLLLGIYKIVQWYRKPHWVLFLEQIEDLKEKYKS